MLEVAALTIKAVVLVVVESVLLSMDLITILYSPLKWEVTVELLRLQCKTNLKDNSTLVTSLKITVLIGI